MFCVGGLVVFGLGVLFQGSNALATFLSPQFCNHCDRDVLHFFGVKLFVTVGIKFYRCRDELVWSRPLLGLEAAVEVPLTCVEAPGVEPTATRCALLKDIVLLEATEHSASGSRMRGPGIHTKANICVALHRCPDDRESAAHRNAIYGRHAKAKSLSRCTLGKYNQCRQTSRQLPDTSHRPASA